jgi:hypothetical protein
MARLSWWLADDRDTRRRIDAGGILIGRSPGCELVLRHPKASRMHALVYADGDVPRLVVLGRGKTSLDGAAVTRETQLGEGARLELPGAVLHVVASTEPAERRDAGWVLERPGGGCFGVSSYPFVIGGHDTDDVKLVGWPDHALILHLTQGRLHLSASTALEVDGQAVESGALVPIGAGSRVVHEGQTLRVMAGGELGQAETLASRGDGDPALPHRVHLELLPHGGRLQISAATGEHAVYLPGQRCDLMATLLQPPAPHAPGEIVDDALLLARLWPRQARTRVDLNTLIYRLRRDLVRAGIDASAFVVRAPGGGGTRLALAAGAVVRVG